MREVFDSALQVVHLLIGLALKVLRLLAARSLKLACAFWDKIKYLFNIFGELRYVSDIFNDWVTRAAGIVLALLLVNLAFNIFFVHFQQQYPFLQLISLVMALVFVISGGILFFIAIVKYNE